MALDPKQAAQLAEMLREIERLSAKFSANINTVNLQDLETNAGAIKSIFDDLIRQEKELGAETDYLIDNFKELTKKIQNSSSGIQESTKGLKNLSSIAEQLNSHQKGFNELSAKDIKNLQQRANLERDRLKRSLDTLNNESDALRNQLANLPIQNAEYASIQEKLDKIVDQHEKVKNLIANEDITLGELNNQLDKEYQKVDQIEKKLGLTDAMLKGISKIPFIGDAVDTEKALNASKDAINEGTGKLGAMKAALKSVGGDVLASLKDPLTVSLFLIKQIFEAIKKTDAGIGEFAKGMNLTYTEAAKLDREFNNIANSSGSVAVTTRGIRESVLAIGQALGSNAILNAKDAISMTQFREQAGLAQDELNEMQKISLATNKNLEDNVASTIYAAKVTGLKNGVLLNEKQIMSEVAKASAATKLSLSNTPELVARAAAQAKALGMNLEQVSNIADKLLNIESSISDELEAELLTGKNLNLEQARLYALNNDMEGLSREIAKNFGNAADFSQMNRIQQEAAAKAVGMSREELAKTLTDQEALKGLSGAQAKDAQAALDAARARGMSEEDIKKKGVEGLKQQQSMQDRLNKSVEKLQELFVSLAEPLLPVLDILSSILKVVGLILTPIGWIVSGLNQIGNLGESIGKSFGKMGAVLGYTFKTLIWAAGSLAAMVAYAMASMVPIIGPILGPIAAAAVLSFTNGLASKVTIADDMVSQPGYGKRTLMGPEGAIALNDKDTVIAGTNLFDKKGNDIVSEPGKSTTFKGENKIKTSSGVDMSAVIEELRSLKAAIQTFNQKPVQVAVTMDGRKVAEGLGNHATQLGTSANVGTSKIQ
jgi:hypothetical protein